MRFLVITNAPTLSENSNYVAYEPYVREMDVWSKYVDDFVIISPTKHNGSLLVSKFKKQPSVVSLPNLNFTSFFKIIKSLLLIPSILLRLFIEIKKADHVHLRCPGNIGLLGCLVQILFPSKVKTAKYAGNWDPNSKQPLSYRLQKGVLSNTFLTKNINVLVYGKWQNQTKNITSFFTATFFENEIEKVQERNYSNKLNVIFVGSLVEGKRPLLAIKVIEQLKKQGEDVSLDVYGDGILKEELQGYVTKNQLTFDIVFHGNKSKLDVKEALKKAHFLILPSKSEGWPKVVAEAMFFGAIPISTKVSCVPYMLDEGKRGILIDPEISLATEKILSYIKNEDLNKLSQLAVNWSQKYTLDVFESEIKKMIV